MKPPIEKELEQYTQLKIDLLKISNCIEYCEKKKYKEIYQNIALEYSKEMKNLKDTIEKEYQVILCKCCK
ncbi:hypothetical protein BLX87_22070 [Bacillus sp. VT-16-64]|nr:hypothetical protein BLX87_22070 [Bacillus sp. VT-16-64]